jgi:hypothetical protein
VEALGGGLMRSDMISGRDIGEGRRRRRIYPRILEAMMENQNSRGG